MFRWRSKTKRSCSSPEKALSDNVESTLPAISVGKQFGATKIVVPTRQQWKIMRDEKEWPKADRIVILVSAWNKNVLLTEQLFQPKLCAAWTFKPRQPCHSSRHFLTGEKNYKLHIQSDFHFPEFSASDNLFSHQSFSILAKMMECSWKKPWDSTFLIWNKMTKLLEPGWHQLITTSTGLPKLHGHIRLADQQADFDAAIQEMRVKMEREQELLAAVQGVYGNTWYSNKTVMVPEAKCEDLYREFLNLPLRSYRRREPNACKSFICSWFVLYVLTQSYGATSHPDCWHVHIPRRPEPSYMHYPTFSHKTNTTRTEIDYSCQLIKYIMRCLMFEWKE